MGNMRREIGVLATKSECFTAKIFLIIRILNYKHKIITMGTKINYYLKGADV